MKLLIVDDEEIIRKGIRGFAAGLGCFDQIFTESNAKDAYNTLVREEPEILVSDVVMPGISGIQFIQQASGVMPHLKIIMISGHSDTDFLKSSMKTGAVDYLFKPVLLDELEEVLRRTVNASKKEQAQRRQNDLANRLLMESQPLWRERLCRDLLEGTATPARLEKSAALTGLSLPSRCRYLVVRLERCAHAPVGHGESDMTRGAGLKKHAEETFGTAFTLLAIQSASEQAALLLFVEEDDADLTSRICACAETLRGFFPGETLCGGVGMPVAAASEIPQSGREAESRLAHSRFLSGELVFSPKDKTLREGDETRYQRLKALLAQAVYHLSEEDISATLEEIRAYFLGRPETRTSADFQQEAAGLTDELLRMGELEYGSDWYYERLRNLFSMQTLQQLLEWLMEILRALRSEHTKGTRNKTAILADKARSIVRGEWHTGINVQDIAYRIGVSPNYLSAVFKADEGVNLAEYITNLRLDHAASKLLKTTQMIREIALSVGYDDQNYFSKLFRKRFGCSPSEYRSEQTHSCEAEGTPT